MVRAGIYIPDKTYKKIKNHCQLYGKKVSPFVVFCVNKYLDDETNFKETPIKSRNAFMDFVMGGVK